MPQPLLASASPPARECTYNLFRNRRRADLFCAVPEHRPVPNFLAPEDWAFERPLHVAEPAPAGFDDRAAVGCGEPEITMGEVLALIPA
jgi:hypothetical protein